MYGRYQAKILCILGWQRRLHVIGEATEAGVMPIGVEGIPTRIPKATPSPACTGERGERKCGVGEIGFG